MNDQNNQEHTTFYDQADDKFEKTITQKKKLSHGVVDDHEEEEKDDEGNLVNAEKQVRETEDASLQDDSYSFDESNTDNEEYHDVNYGDDFDLDNDDDFVR